MGRSIAGLHKDLLRGRLKLQGPDGKLIRETYPSAKRKFKGKFVLRVRQKHKGEKEKHVKEIEVEVEKEMCNVDQERIGSRLQKMKEKKHKKHNISKKKKDKKANEKWKKQKRRRVREAYIQMISGRGGGPGEVRGPNRRQEEAGVHTILSGGDNTHTSTVDDYAHVDETSVTVGDYEYATLDRAGPRETH